MGLHATRRHRVPVSILSLLFLLQPCWAHAATVPLWSEVEYLVIAGEQSSTNKTRQELAQDRITEDFRLAKDGLVLDVAVDAAWTGVGSGSVAFDHFRGDDNPNGFRENFHGETSFRFAFSVDVASEISIDYAALGATTSISTNGTIRWWAMHGFEINVEREGTGPVWNLLGFQNDFAPINAPSPQGYDGTITVPLAAGMHLLEINLSEDAFGNFLGDRTVSGSFMFAVNDVSISETPLPAALWLLCAVLPLLGRQRRQTS